MLIYTQLQALVTTHSRLRGDDNGHKNANHDDLDDFKYSLANVLDQKILSCCITNTIVSYDINNAAVILMVTVW